MIYYSLLFELGLIEHKSITIQKKTRDIRVLLVALLILICSYTSNKVVCLPETE